MYIIPDRYSARVIRELYTHIGGGSTRLQASTRYNNYQDGFKYVVPPKIKNYHEANDIYNKTVKEVLDAMQRLEVLGIPKESTVN